MNRTLLPKSKFKAPLASSQSPWLKREAFAASPTKRDTSTAFSCFSPMHYESGYAYPLIVWLHGPRSNEDELRQVMPLISMRNHVAIAPRGTSSEAGVRGGYRWDTSAEQVAEAVDRVRQCIAIAQDRYNIHSERIFIAGHSTGGTMAHRVAMAMPEEFAGAISLGGRVPRGQNVLRHINRARKLPLLLSVSPTEGKYSTDEVTDDLRFLHCAGFSLSLRLYPAGDELTTVMFSDMNNWVMEQFCPASSAQAC